LLHPHSAGAFAAADVGFEGGGRDDDGAGRAVGGG
jgi:hypothetical protein